MKPLQGKGKPLQYAVSPLPRNRRLRPANLTRRPSFPGNGFCTHSMTHSHTHLVQHSQRLPLGRRWGAWLVCLLFSLAATAQVDLRTDFRHSTDSMCCGADALVNNTDEGLEPAAAAPARTMPHRAMNTTLDNGLGLYGTSARGTVASIGAPRIPVVMVAYADLDFLPEDDAVKIGRWLNEEGYSDETYCVGSVADYFRDNSYGIFTPQFEVVARVTMPHPYAYYGAHSGSANDVRAQQLVRDAIDAAVLEGVDFSLYASDGRLPIVGIIHAGPGEQEDFGYQYPGQSSDDYIWAHYRTLGYNRDGLNFASYIVTNEAMRYFDANGRVTRTTMTGIGTFCHEFCHALGLPDTYDVNGSTSGSGHTPGFWDVMDYQFMLNGFRPGCLNAYERCCLGWLDIPTLSPTTDGSVALFPLDGTLESDDFLRAVRIVHPTNDHEYFIFENRQPSRWHVDKYGQTPILGTGMLVWHIDYNASSWSSNVVNVNASRQRVSVVPADGEWQSPAYGTDTYPGDLFPGPTDATTFDGRVAEFYDAPFERSFHSICESPDGIIYFSAAAATSIATSLSRNVPQTYYNLLGQPIRSTNAPIISGGRVIFPAR